MIPRAFEDKKQPSLIIALFNEKPINAAQLGRLLSDFETDYRRLYGRSLVVGRLEPGSYWISLLDDAAWTITTGVGTAIAIEGGKALYAYAKQLKASFSHAEMDLDLELLPSPNESFVEELQGAEGLVRTAQEGGAAFQLVFENAPDGSGRRISFTTSRRIRGGFPGG
ncbi:hypothetical protein NKI51_27375 [Mesorhizobium australicum]|uniref:hypothetical protein n=1 Tax=Mesorhizobium australicum TaxID=536018 RepID=UPI0033383D5E